MSHVERLNYGIVTQNQNENAERLLRPRCTALSVMWAEFFVLRLAKPPESASFLLSITTAVVALRIAADLFITHKWHHVEEPSLDRLPTPTQYWGPLN